MGCPSLFEPVEMGTESTDGVACIGLHNPAQETARVPGAGLEPARGKPARDFKSLVSACSTTPASVEASAKTWASVVPRPQGMYSLKGALWR